MKTNILVFLTILAPCFAFAELSAPLGGTITSKDPIFHVGDTDTASAFSVESFQMKCDLDSVVGSVCQRLVLEHKTVSEDQEVKLQYVIFDNSVSTENQAKFLSSLVRQNKSTILKPTLDEQRINAQEVIVNALWEIPLATELAFCYGAGADPIGDGGCEVKKTRIPLGILVAPIGVAIDIVRLPIVMVKQGIVLPIQSLVFTQKDLKKLKTAIEYVSAAKNENEVWEIAKFNRTYDPKSGGVSYSMLTGKQGIDSAMLSRLTRLFRVK